MKDNIFIRLIGYEVVHYPSVTVIVLTDLCADEKANLHPYVSG